MKGFCFDTTHIFSCTISLKTTGRRCNTGTEIDDQEDLQPSCKFLKDLFGEFNGVSLYCINIQNGSNDCSYKKVFLIVMNALYLLRNSAVSSTLQTIVAYLAHCFGFYNVKCCLFGSVSLLSNEFYF